MSGAAGVAWGEGVTSWSEGKRAPPSRIFSATFVAIVLLGDRLGRPLVRMFAAPPELLSALEAVEGEGKDLRLSRM